MSRLSLADMNNFNRLDIELLIEILDTEKDGTVSLDRLLALGNALKTDRRGKKQTMRHTAVELLKATVLVAVIVLVGIFAFIEMEHDEYQEQVNKNLLLKAEIEQALPVLGSMTDILNLTSQYDEELDSTLRAIYDNYTNETLWDQLDENGFVSTFSLANPWNFEDSAWFVFTIVTTVGYGHIAPITKAGRFFVIFYSIPAIISMAYFIKMLINYYNSCPCKKGSVRTQVLTLPLFFIFYLWVSGWILHLCEGWRTGEGVYYIWITISTIGFGDYTTNSNDTAIENAVILLVLVNGLFLFSYAINVIGNVLEYFTKPERWVEVFNRAKLNKIEMTIPLVTSSKSLKKSESSIKTSESEYTTAEVGNVDNDVGEITKI